MNNANLIRDLENWCLLRERRRLREHRRCSERSFCSRPTLSSRFLQLQGFEAEVFRARARAHPTKEFEQRLGRPGHGTVAGHGHFSHGG